MLSLVCFDYHCLKCSSQAPLLVQTQRDSMTFTPHQLLLGSLKKLLMVCFCVMLDVIWTFACRVLDVGFPLLHKYVH